MTYEPAMRKKTGMQTFSRGAMSVICDVCKRPRTKGNHSACSKARQAAGFVISKNPKAELAEQGSAFSETGDYLDAD